MDRIQGVDLFRLLAIAAVIVIHTTPFESAATPIGVHLDSATVINQLARFAVPYFFVISGYFWASKFQDEKTIIQPTLKMTKHLFMLFITWSAVYSLLDVNFQLLFNADLSSYARIAYWDYLKTPIAPLALDFILNGSKVHLWFLSSLFICLLISAVLIHQKMIRQLIALSIFLFAIGLSGKAYAATPFGFQSDFNFRNGPFFGNIFFVSGYLLQRRGPQKSWLTSGLILAAVGWLLHFSEIKMLNEYWHTTMYQDFVLGTYFLGVGIAMIALSNKITIKSSLISSIGPLVLGIYAVHYLFIDILYNIDSRLSGFIPWEIGYPLAVLICSAATTVVMRRVRLVKAMVN